MNFNSHVNNVCKKAGKQVSALHRLTGVLEQKSRMATYQTLLWQISTTVLLSGSFHLDLVSVNLKKSRKGPSDLH